MNGYKQIFRPAYVITRAPWYWVLWANVQEHCGWYWLRRKTGNPHPWDERTE